VWLVDRDDDEGLVEGGANHMERAAIYRFSFHQAASTPLVRRVILQQVSRL
jgi:hypothetical protein